MAEHWIYAEQQGGSLGKTTWELITAAQSLGHTVGAVLLGQQVTPLASQLGDHGAQKVYAVDDAKLAHFTPEGYTATLAQLVKTHQPRLLLFPASFNARSLSGRLAARLQAGVAGDVISVELAPEGVVVRRPVFAGKAVAKLHVTSEPAIISVRANIFPPAPAGAGSAQVVVSGAASEHLRTIFKEFSKSQGGKLDLKEADIIVSGGRGLGGPESFRILEELAAVLGAAVGASRAAVDAGWRPHSDQVGQTGKTVNPTLYIACGISGAIQHLAGMSSSKYIVAINKDPEAPIFKVANYGIVGDLFQVVPALTREARKLKGLS
ncbi:MAG: electron transfer flavoprotein subunit alpha/FixB family protein [Deinococcus sp.]|nr:electron transfer flavoprotein subunit alpha/FixB family protein [Deinococcus sp.]